MATHCSGLPFVPDNFNPKDPSNPYVDYSVEDFYKFLNDYELETVPGTYFEYSSVGMGLLGHILSLKAGLSYEQLISESILKKLKMKHTGISLTPEMREELAKGHDLKRVVEYWDWTEAAAGAGAFAQMSRT